MVNFNDVDLDSFGADAVAIDFPNFGIQLPPVNPYHTPVGFNYDPKLYPLPPQETAPPPPPKIDLKPASVVFLERLPNGLEEGAPSGVFKVRINGEGERVLKIFRGVEKAMEKAHRSRSFTREVLAYGNLLHHGACATGVVPHFYGWTKIDPDEWQFPNGEHDWLYRFREDPEPPRALILEFLPNASRMTLRCITPQRADAVVEALKIIHGARVCHGDIHPRNILLLPDDRIVWVDFECAGTWPHHRLVNTHEFELELNLCWAWMFCTLMPWKWYISRRWNERVGKEVIDTKSLEHSLVRRGYKILIPMTERVPEDVEDWQIRF